MYTEYIITGPNFNLIKQISEKVLKKKLICLSKIKRNITTDKMIIYGKEYDIPFIHLNKNRYCLLFRGNNSLKKEVRKIKKWFPFIKIIIYPVSYIYCSKTIKERFKNRTANYEDLFHDIEYYNNFMLVKNK